MHRLHCSSFSGGYLRVQGLGLGSIVVVPFWGYFRVQGLGLGSIVVAPFWGDLRVQGLGFRLHCSSFLGVAYGFRV